MTKSRGWAYFDPSVLAKRYVREPGAALARLLLRRHAVVTSVITPLELRSALARRAASGELTTSARDAVLRRLDQDREGWELVELGDAVVRGAESLLDAGHGLRALDALHLASALVLRDAKVAFSFVTADAAQRAAAERLLRVVVFVE